MALLAETKRKIRYGIDPRNTNWSNDDSKFGQRLMEKMGWEKGKGLGANESGMVDHIKASYKSDTRGLGCTPKDADAWIAHQDDFNDLLKALNSEHGDGSNTDSRTEEKTRTDGQKRYYGRFARGRVATLRSTEDLDCIFGKRKASSAPVSSDSDSENATDEDTKEESRHGLTTVTSSSSVQEYFAKKMAEMKARRALGSAETAVNAQGRDESERQEDSKSAINDRVPPVYGAVGFSYGDAGEREVGEDKGRDEKRVVTFSLGQSDEEFNSNTDESRKKKKKKKSKTKDSDADEQISGQLVDEEESIQSDRKKRKSRTHDCGEDGSEEVMGSKAKKRKGKPVSSEGEEQEVGVSSVRENESDKPSSDKKHKKKKKSHETAKDNAETEGQQNNEGNVSTKKSKKKSNSIGDEVETKDLDVGSISEKKTKTKKKKDKVRDGEETFAESKNSKKEEVAFSGAAKRKKRKKGEESKTSEKEGVNEENTKCDGQTVEESRNSDAVDEPGKSKKKKKRSKIEESSREKPMEENAREKKSKRRRKVETEADPTEATKSEKLHYQNENEEESQENARTSSETKTDTRGQQGHVYNNQESEEKSPKKRKKNKKKKLPFSGVAKTFVGSNLASIAGYGV